jgi:DNA polymerase I-like protein with 3'-5' exonuclease and polymerase domains
MNVPSNEKPYGKACRSLFITSEGKVLVGIDASALELRALAARMALWDNGKYRDVVLNGKKEDGTEIHSVNMRALEILSRAIAKRFFYAYIYGGGDFKLGLILGGSTSLGKRKRALFEKNLPALDSLITAVKDVSRRRKYLIGLDGRKIYVRSLHSCLNRLLQSDGAILMKKALVILDKFLQEDGLVPGIDYEFVGNIHDEWQIECSPEISEFIGKAGVDSIKRAGEYFNYKCPLTGEYNIGANWAETH